MQHSIKLARDYNGRPIVKFQFNDSTAKAKMIKAMQAMRAEYELNGNTVTFLGPRYLLDVDTNRSSVGLKLQNPRLAKMVQDVFKGITMYQHIMGI